MVNMMANEKNIPDDMIKILINHFKMKVLLGHLKKSYQEQFICVQDVMFYIVKSVP